MGQRNTMSIRSVTDPLGIERASPDRGVGLARFLGWLSLGMGVTTLAAGPTVSRLTGIDGSPAAQRVLWLAGVRELGHAATLLVGRRARWGTWVRVAGDAVDLVACGAGMRRRIGQRRRRLGYTSAAVAAVTALDLYAAVRASRGQRRRGEKRVHASVTVNRGVADVYRFWHDFENLPRFMDHLRSVRVIDDRRSRWTAKAPAGRTVEWEAEIVDDRPNELIEWRSVPGAKVRSVGRVSFRPTPDRHGTEVRVELDYSPPGRWFGALVASAFAENPHQQVRDDLRRFKQVIETGEITRSDGMPHGVSMRHQVMQRPAQPLAGHGAPRR